ncbi:MAG: alpha/beta fold hydrolase [Planctomycetales bacterium]|nr:alpha/beta fold hydrolase [Planctomycetales bacterium]
MCLLLALVVTSPGCATQQLVKLRSQPYNPLAEQLKLTAHGGPKPSERTQQLLRRFDLDSRPRGDAADVIASLATIHEQSPSLESCYALAELNYIAGQRQQLRRREKTQANYWNCVARTYEYLFDPRYQNTRNRYDPEFRGACDLYNSALESCLRFARKDGRLAPNGTLSFPMGDRTMEVKLVVMCDTWNESDFDRFEFVSDYDVRRLPNHYHNYGLGVPLIAVRDRDQTPQPGERHFAKDLSFPVTAFLRLNSTNLDDGFKSATARLELHDPLAEETIAVTGHRVPLESDLSTPLAYFLNNPELRALDTRGLLRPNEVEAAAGLYLTQPYQPGKIPVVLIHGVWSSPMAWMEMFNDLQSMPDIRERYQFWFYMYPTGKPFYLAAQNLRQDLEDIRAEFDPQHVEPTFSQTVLVGHSMGGLIARLLTLESDSEGATALEPHTRSANSGKIQQVSGGDRSRGTPRSLTSRQKTSPGARGEKEESFVSRVVTIGSPHRGSEYANSFTRLLGKKLISLPVRAVAATRRTLHGRSRPLFEPPPDDDSTSLDTLSPDSPILRVMLETPQPGGVRYHNVVGAIRRVSLEENTDGVVTYRSAHLDRVESEIVVPAEHSQLPRHPRTVLEVRRILLEHLQAVAREQEH